MENVLEQFFSFSTIIEKLKVIERFKGQYYWRDYPPLPRYESVADHTWRLTILIMLFENKLSQKINSEKALKMALIHDLPEIITGDASPVGEEGTGNDTYAYRKELKEEKYSQEKEAAAKLFGKLPKYKSDELFDLWLEYEEQNCFEAKIVKALDGIESMLQVLEYRNGHMFPRHLTFTLAYNLKHSDADPAIYQFGQVVAKELKKKYKEFNADEQ